MTYKEAEKELKRMQTAFDFMIALEKIVQENNDLSENLCREAMCRTGEEHVILEEVFGNAANDYCRMIDKLKEKMSNAVLPE